jgi:hypothetical protein
VRTHILVCMLAEHVAWHLREAWRPMLFAKDQAAKSQRDPVAPASRSKAAERKAQKRLAENGQPIHSFQTLMQELTGIERSTCRAPGSTDLDATFQVATTANTVQQRALDLAAQFKV